ncbi:MAG: (d)CMP kinase, partial [Saprospiraceae bacterium]
MLEPHRPITIAIDGFSACGKSTLAKSLALAMHYVYIDSGAMYRAITWYCIQLGIKASELMKVEKALNEIDLRFAIHNGQNSVLVDGRVLDLELRSLVVNEQVSYFAEIPFARRKLVSLQQSLGSKGGVVMDGRDIAT